MKKLIALLTLVFCFNCYSQTSLGGRLKPTPTPTLSPSGATIGKAEKPIYSKHGLEGWGKENGVMIMVENHDKRLKQHALKAIKNQVELKLKLAGIKVTTKGTNTSLLYINITEIITNRRVVGHDIDIRPHRLAYYKANDKWYRKSVGINNYGGLHSPTSSKDLIDNLMNKLLLDYLKANPKPSSGLPLPKEKKSLIEP